MFIRASFANHIYDNLYRTLNKEFEKQHSRRTKWRELNERVRFRRNNLLPNHIIRNTKLSLNTQSFILGTSFQENSRVLAKVAFKSRINWLKGMKENVVLVG